MLCNSLIVVLYLKRTFGLLSQCTFCQQNKNWVAGSQTEVRDYVGMGRGIVLSSLPRELSGTITPYS